MRKSIAAVALVAAASMSLVGLAPTASAADGVAVAKAIVAKYSKNPTTIGDVPVIGKPIPKGKYVIALANNGESGVTLNSFTLQAGKLLGWKMESISMDPTLDAQRQALTLAISKNPDGITVGGMEPSSFGDLYKKAAANGIAIVCQGCLSAAGGGLIDTHISGPKMVDLWGQMIAAFTVANVKGTPNVQAFGLSVYPILQRFDAAYKKNLQRLSPAATYNYNEFDFKTGVPQQVANSYKANAGTNQVVSDLGDLFIGVPQALFTVGATPGQVPLVGGFVAGKDAIQSLKNKTENAWTGNSLPIIGYSMIDSLARYWTNTKQSKADLPTQILTQKNVGTAVIDSEGNYVGVKNFESQFKTIWGVK